MGVTQRVAVGTEVTARRGGPEEGKWTNVEGDFFIFLLVESVFMLRIGVDLTTPIGDN